MGEEYAKREKEIAGRKYSGNFENDRVTNIFDIYIRHNIEARSKGRTSDILDQKAILGMLWITQIAGSDTSRASSSHGLTYIAEQPEIQEKI